MSEVNIVEQIINIETGERKTPKKKCPKKYLNTKEFYLPGKCVKEPCKNNCR